MDAWVMRGRRVGICVGCLEDVGMLGDGGVDALNMCGGCVV